jgi:hypothetical protein
VPRLFIVVGPPLDRVSPSLPPCEYVGTLEALAFVGFSVVLVVASLVAFDAVVFFGAADWLLAGLAAADLGVDAFLAIS